MVGLDSRSLKALAIAADVAHWQRLPTGAYLIPSQTAPGQTYRTTPQSCSCPAAERHPERLCKHSLATVLYESLSTMDTPPAPSAPLSEAEVDALFARF